MRGLVGNITSYYVFLVLHFISFVTFGLARHRRYALVSSALNCTFTMNLLASSICFDFASAIKPSKSPTIRASVQAPRQRRHRVYAQAVHKSRLACRLDTIAAVLCKFTPMPIRRCPLVARYLVKQPHFVCVRSLWVFIQKFKHVVGNSWHHASP